MSEREGYRQVWMKESVYQMIQRLQESHPPPKPGAAALQQQQGGGCGLVIIFDPAGDIVDAHCGGGGCGILGWLLGRSCKAEFSPSGGGHSLSCRCGGGWFDRIFGG